MNPAGVLAAINGTAQLQAVNPDTAPQDPPLGQGQHQHEAANALRMVQAGLLQMKALTL